CSAPPPPGRDTLSLHDALPIFTGTVLATEADPTGWWLSFRGLVAVYAAQIGAMVFGAVVAAAGRPYGYSLGLLVGAVCGGLFLGDRKSTRLNSSHVSISYAVFC